MIKTCSKCGLGLQLSEFYSTKRGRPASECKKCHGRRMHEVYKRNTEVVKKRNRLWAIANPEKRREYSKIERIKNRDKRRIKWLQLHQERKDLVLNHFGNRCNCCGETRRLFLSVDHVNGNGKKHRRENKIGNIVHWLVRNNFPKGFQILCHNCNVGRHLNGGVCPHREGKTCELA